MKNDTVISCLWLIVGAVLCIFVPPLSPGWWLMCAWWAGMAVFGLFTGERR